MAALPKDQGFIVCANHCTKIDPLVVGHMLYSNGHPPHFLAKASLFRMPLFGKLLSISRQIPVNRGDISASSSLELAEELLKDNGTIVIYPEGTLTRDPELWPMTGRTGAARLALSTGAAIVPVAQWGAHELFPRYGKRFRLFPRKTAKVVVGKPVDLSKWRADPGLRDKADFEEATEQIMKSITELLAEVRNEVPPSTGWDRRRSSEAASMSEAPGSSENSELGSDVEKSQRSAERKDAESQDGATCDGGSHGEKHIETHWGQDESNEAGESK